MSGSGRGTMFPLPSLPDELRKDPVARKKCINEADIVFLCLPDAAARGVRFSV